MINHQAVRYSFQVVTCVTLLVSLLHLDSSIGVQNMKYAGNIVSASPSIQMPDDNSWFEKNIPLAKARNTTNLSLSKAASIVDDLKQREAEKHRIEQERQAQIAQEQSQLHARANQQNFEQSSHPQTQHSPQAQSHSVTQSQPTTSTPAPAPETYVPYIHVQYGCADGVNDSETCASDAVNRYQYAFMDFSRHWGRQIIAGHTSPVLAQLEVSSVINTNYGKYRVYSIIWRPRMSGLDVNTVPPGFWFQTCIGNQMKLAYAERIG